MKRSPMPRRRASLRRGRPLDRRRALPRGRVSGRARPDEPLAVWCEAAIEGVCTGRAEHRHHVRLRAQGGSDDASNTRDLCVPCHGWVHANTGAAYELGLLARAAVDPTEETPWP